MAQRLAPEVRRERILDTAMELLGEKGYRGLTMKTVAARCGLTAPAVTYYFKNMQTRDVHYKSFLRPDDKPAIWLNKDVMERFRPQMQKMYYDASKYDTYLEQLGIKYPTVR